MTSDTLRFGIPVQVETSAARLEASLLDWGASYFSATNVAQFWHGFGGRTFSKLEVMLCHHRFASEATFRGMPYYRQPFVVSGACSARIGKSDRQATGLVSFVMAPNVENTLRFSDSLEQLLVRIPETVLQRKVASLLGLPDCSDLRFSNDATASSGLRLQRRVLRLLLHEASAANPSSIALSALQDVFLTQLLFSNPHNYLELLLRPAQAAIPRKVRLVEEYLEAHWDQGVTIEDAAAIAGTSARSIYAAFKQHRSYSPKALLRQIRLRKARELLQTTNYEIGEIAKRCGFSNHSHLTRYYKAAFGELPSETRRS